MPLVVAISTTLAARNGLLVRDRRGLEEARNVDTVIFDKTGTNSRGRLVAHLFFEHHVVQLAGEARPTETAFPVSWGRYVDSTKLLDPPTEERP